MILTNIDRVQRIYDARSDIAFDGQTYLASVRRDIDLLEAAGIETDAFVCDVGCGLGWHLSEMHDRGFAHLYGIDVSEQTLRRFEERSKAVRSGHIKLVYGDVSNWNVRGFFDVVTAFLSCIGEFSKRGDLAFLKAVGQLARKEGVVVFSCLSREDAEMITGASLVKYSATTEETVTNDVRLDKSGKWLTISQTTSAGFQVPDERIYLYSAAEIEALTTRAGLRIESMLHPIAGDRLQSARLTIFARPF